MLHIDHLLERIGQACYITTLDLCKGYWQVPQEKWYRDYTAYRTPAGLFQFTIMPFVLHGAPATFQQLMDHVLQGCDDCCVAYLDDLQHLQRVLHQIHEAGMTLSRNVSGPRWKQSTLNICLAKGRSGHKWIRWRLYPAALTHTLGNRFVRSWASLGGHHRGPSD